MYIRTSKRVCIITWTSKRILMLLTKTSSATVPSKLDHILAADIRGITQESSSNWTSGENSSLNGKNRLYGFGKSFYICIHICIQNEEVDDTFFATFLISLLLQLSHQNSDSMSLIQYFQYLAKFYLIFNLELILPGKYSQVLTLNRL